MNCGAEWDSEKYLLYDLGRVTLRPQLEVGESYDSNIFYAETSRVADFVTSIRPGLNTVLGDLSLNFTALRLTLDASIYADRSDLNNVGYIFGHQSRYRFDRWQLQGTDSLAITDALLGGSFSYIQKQVGQIALSDGWRADYEISPKTVAGVRVGLDYVDYDADDLAPNHLYDYLTYVGGVRLGYLPSEKITLFPEFSAGQSFLSQNSAAYPDSPNLNFYGISAGAEGEFTPKLFGLVAGGYEFRDYEDDTEIPNGWVADMRLSWQARPKTTVSVAFRHFLQSSREASGIAYTANRPTLSVVQEFGTRGRWLANLDFYYQFDDYDQDFIVNGKPVARQDDLAGLTLRGSYRWKPWLLVAAGYEFLMYNDNINEIPDYEVHRVSLRLIAGY